MTGLLESGVRKPFICLGPTTEVSAHSAGYEEVPRVWPFNATDKLGPDISELLSMHCSWCVLDCDEAQPNPQEERLRPFDLNVADTRRSIEMQVMGARACDDRNCPIPIVSFWGETDGVVRSASAEASFEKFVVLPGDHSTVLHPKLLSPDSQVYKELTGALLKPEGHRHIYEIDSYETTVAVSPLTGDQQAFVAKRRGVASTEHSDNFAQITRKVCFSSKNHCVDLFRFNYQTNERGYLVANVDMQPREFGEAVPPNMAL